MSTLYCGRIAMSVRTLAPHDESTDAIHSSEDKDKGMDDIVEFFIFRSASVL